MARPRARTGFPPTTRSSAPPSRSKGTPNRIGSAPRSSPWGPALGVTYPAADAETLVAASEAAGAAWAAATPETRVGLRLEALARLNAMSFEMANAVMHTTGQAFPMAFQAGGPHAQDRGSRRWRWPGPR